jgi:hypothetical protein
MGERKELITVPEAKREHGNQKTLAFLSQLVGM